MAALQKADRIDEARTDLHRLLKRRTFIQQSVVEELRRHL
jgi:hypothetical protein